MDCSARTCRRGAVGRVRRRFFAVTPCSMCASKRITSASQFHYDAGSLLAFQAKTHENVADGDYLEKIQMEVLAEHLGEGILVQGFEWNTGAC
jgi:hypothetical protein